MIKVLADSISSETCLLTVPSHGLSSLGIRAEAMVWSSTPVSLLIRMLILSDQGPILMISFNVNYLLRGPISKNSHTRS